MKSDFLLAITQLSAEKNLPKEVVITAIEAALVSAYRKDSFALNQNIAVKINPNTGKVEVWAEKTIVDVPSDKRLEISLEEAQKVNPQAQTDDTLMVEDTPYNAGRIAAQTAKQVILQRLHEAEHSAIFEEYANKEGEVVTGVMQRMEFGQIFVDLGRTEALLPAAEQVRIEQYRVGQRLKVLILQVMHTSKGARVVVSRSHPDLLRRLFELEVPEVLNGAVEIKSIAREAGFRSKVAVTARQEGIDPVGCCVGLRGIRIQNVVNELHGEKIDVVMWNPDVTIFIANALSPANIVSVELNEEEEIATVVVPDRQLSLAIGKEGQNVRLAAKLTGWRIDIKSASVAEAERLAMAKPSVEVAEAAAEEAPEEAKEIEVEAIIEEAPAEIPDILEAGPVPEEPPAGEAPAIEAEPSPATEKVEQPVFFGPQLTEEKPKLRFAEDILVPRPEKSTAKPKKKKKKGAYGKELSEDGIRIKKARLGPELADEEGEDY